MAVLKTPKIKLMKTSQILDKFQSRDSLVFFMNCISYFVMVGFEISFNGWKYLEIVGNDGKLLEMVNKSLGKKWLEITQNDWK